MKAILLAVVGVGVALLGMGLSRRAAPAGGGQSVAGLPLFTMPEFDLGELLTLDSAGYETPVSGARGIRNNNPGNIRAGDQWQGMTGIDGGGFVIFSAPEWGIRAMTVLIRNYRNLYGINTVRGIIARWAPPNENNTGAYISSVANQVGVGPDSELTESHIPALLRAIIRHENGSQPYSADLINRGIALA